MKSFVDMVLAAVLSLGSNWTTPRQDPKKGVLVKQARVEKAVRKSKATLPNLSCASGAAACPLAEAGPFVNEDYATIEESVTTGYCVPLVQRTVGVGATKTWRPGSPLKDKPNLKPGTVIATFEEGKYASNTTGNHAAYFVGYKEGDDGKTVMVVYDQYRIWAKPEEEKMIAAGDEALGNEFEEYDTERKKHFKRKVPGLREIRFDNPGNPSNNADAFSVVTH